MWIAVVTNDALYTPLADGRRVFRVFGLVPAAEPGAGSARHGVDLHYVADVAGDGAFPRDQDFYLSREGWTPTVDVAIYVCIPPLRSPLFVFDVLPYFPACPSCASGAEGCRWACLVAQAGA